MLWIRDNKDLLNQSLSGYYTKEELAQNTMNVLCRAVSGGRGVFYIYDTQSNLLSLTAAYAFHESDKLASTLSLGEGIVGQVALERKPILLRNVKSEKEIVYTSIVSQAPINSYVFPIIYEHQLYGVIEIASLETFDETKLEYLEEASKIIAVSLYSATQNAKIIELLNVSEDARKEINKKAEELENVNEILYSQQKILQDQAEELQQTNAELEEQQQLLQQQSEELRISNLQLEEQQLLLRQQTMMLNNQNAKLEEVKSDLELSNKYKSEFVANMSHELRTPLNSIILLSRLVLGSKKENLSASVKEKINIIHHSGKELLRLINDILDLSKIESGRYTLDNMLFHSSVFEEELKNMFESLAKEKKLEFKIKDKVNHKLYGDRYKISQILRNFISNAIKFTEKGSVSIEFKRDESTEKGVVFSVKDTGIGISEEQQKIIFEEFRQGDSSISRKYGGTGLGLSICMKLAETIGGEIKLISKLGEGSEFILYTQMLISSEDGNEYTQRMGKEEVKTDDEKDTIINKADRQILVIEDDIAFGEYVREIIDDAGFRVIVAGDGKTGIEFAKKYKPSGILLDLSLPDVHGMEVLRELKSIKELRNIPVHVISAANKSNKAQKNGAIGYHQKPVEESEIIRLVNRLVDFAEKTPKNVLIVEDNLAQQEYIKELLEELNVQVEIVDTEVYAKEKIAEEYWDTIILDLELTEGNGFNICKFIGERKLDTPIIIYTSKELTIEQEKEIRKYADSIILKTAYSEERLLDEVTLFLHRVGKGRSSKWDKPIIIKENLALNLEGKSILVVDDDPRNVYTVAAVLEDYHASVVEAYNGQVALEKLNEQKIDLILMDIMMPEMDGFEAIRQIRLDDRYRHIPIIALTAKSLKSDRIRCFEAGANDYISKPLDYGNLIRVITAWISKKV